MRGCQLFAVGIQPLPLMHHEITAFVHRRDFTIGQQASLEFNHRLCSLLLTGDDFEPDPADSAVKLQL